VDESVPQRRRVPGSRRRRPPPGQVLHHAGRQRETKQLRASLRARPQSNSATNMVHIAPGLPLVGVRLLRLHVERRLRYLGHRPWLWLFVTARRRRVMPRHVMLSSGGGPSCLFVRKRSKRLRMRSTEESVHYSALSDRLRRRSTGSTRNLEGAPDGAKPGETCIEWDGMGQSNARLVRLLGTIARPKA
jgi:hypothetical protein